MKAKKGLIIGLVILLLLLLITGGVFAGIFFGTDLLKTEQQKFWKYMAQNEKTINMIGFKDVYNYVKAQEQNSLEANSEIRFYVQDGQNDVKSVLKRMSLKTLKSFDRDKNNRSIDMKLLVDDYQLFDVVYINDGDKYALKSDEVAEVAIGVENNNLKEFARNMGIEDTSNIPDKIITNADNIMNYPEEKIQEVVKGYITAVYDIIPSEKYMETKDVSVTVNGKVQKADLFYVMLSEEECKNLALNLLTYAKQDVKTKEALTQMLKDGLVNGETVDEEYINEVIDELIDKFKDLETSTDEALRINLYVAGKKLIRTEVVLEGKNTMTFEYVANGNVEQLVASTVENSEVKKITVVKETAGNQVTTKVSSDTLEQTEVELKIKTRGSVQQNDMKLEIECVAKDKEEGIQYHFSYVNKADFKKPLSIPELNQNNSAMLNDLSLEQNQNLFLALSQRIGNLFEQKMQYINMTYSEGFTGIPSIDDGIVLDSEITAPEETTEEPTNNEIEQVQPIVQEDNGR